MKHQNIIDIGKNDMKVKIEIEIDIEDVFNNLTCEEQEEFIKEHLDVISLETLEEYVNYEGV